MGSLIGLLSYAIPLILFLASVFLPKDKVETHPNVSSASNIKTVKVADIREPNFTPITTTIKAKRNSEVTSGEIITYKGDDLLVLVNKVIRLPSNYAPGDLVGLDGLVPVTSSGMKLRQAAADALAKMTQAAKAEGIDLIVLSAYRSYWQQQNTFNYWVSKAGLKEAETFSARPGHSQHQLGTAIDFANTESGVDFNQNFEVTTEGAWLANNAYLFGFVLSYPKGKEAVTGYVYEPWHYRYIGIENAARMIQSGSILEEFLQKYGVV